MATVYLTKQERLHVNSLVDTLAAIEREVIAMALNGSSNQAIANKLGVSLRTVESRRSKAMSKLQVQSLPELVKVWLAYVGQFEINL